MKTYNDLLTFKRLLFLVLSIFWGSEGVAQAQFPPVRSDSIVWGEGLLPSDDRDAIVQAIRIGMDRYWNLSDFIHPDRGTFDEEKGREFLQLFQGSDKVYNDLAGLEGEQVSPAYYRDKVGLNMANTGVQFRIGYPYIENIRKVDGYIVAKVLFTKTMLNGLDDRNRIIMYPLKKAPRLPLSVEMKLMDDGAGGYQSSIYAIRSNHVRVRKETTGRYLDLSAGGISGLSLNTTLARPWEGLTAPDGRYVAGHFEVQKAGHFGNSDRLYWIAGLGIRRGILTTSLPEGLTDETEYDSRTINGVSYGVTNWEITQLHPGSEVVMEHWTGYVPVGVRYQLRPGLQTEWLLDAQILAGYSIIGQDMQGTIQRSRLYGPLHEPICAPVRNLEKGDERTTWSQPFVNFRFSPGYYQAIDNWGSSTRTVGWFVRADVELSLLPLFSREGDEQWAILDDNGILDLNTAAGVLYQAVSPLSAGIRIGVYWKMY